MDHRITGFEEHRPSSSVRNENTVCPTCTTGLGRGDEQWPRDDWRQSCASGGDLPSRAEALFSTTGGYRTV